MKKNKSENKQEENNEIKQEARREFLKKMTSIGTIAGVAAVTGGLTLTMTKDIKAQKLTETRNALSFAAAKVDSEKGVIIPNVEAVRNILDTFARNIKSNRKLQTRFKENPRLVLGELGLNFEIQRELLANELNRKEIAVAMAKEGVDWCVCTECCITCVVTNCEGKGATINVGK